MYVYMYICIYIYIYICTYIVIDTFTHINMHIHIYLPITSGLCAARPGRSKNGTVAERVRVGCVKSALYQVRRLAAAQTVQAGKPVRTSAARSCPRRRRSTR